MLLLTSVSTAARAQTSDRNILPPADVVVQLAGVSGASIQAVQIKEQPVVRTVQGKEVTAFNISWLIKTETGETQLKGPFHNVGSSLNKVTLNDFLSSVAKGNVIRIFVDEVSLKNNDGTSSKTRWGAAYKIVP